MGLSVSALLHHGGYEGTANQFGLRADYKALTDRLIRTLLEARPRGAPVPHVIPIGFPAEDDYTVSQQLQQQYPELKLAPRFKGPIEAKSYISGMDFFVGARMHATIGAFSAGVPVVPLAYSRKFAGLYQSLDYHRVVDLKTEDTDSALELVLAHWTTVNSSRPRSPPAARSSVASWTPTAPRWNRSRRRCTSLRPRIRDNHARPRPDGGHHGGSDRRAAGHPADPRAHAGAERLRLHFHRHHGRPSSP